MYLDTISSFFDLLTFCSSPRIKTFKLCCYIRFANSNTTFYRGSDSQLLCLNSICEFAFSIWRSPLLEFYCRLLVHLYASLVCISRKIISVAWSIFVAYRSLFYPRMFLFKPINSSRCYKLLIYLICIQIVVDGNAIFHLFM